MLAVLNSWSPELHTMKAFQATCLIGFATVSCSTVSSVICPNKCQSAIGELQRRVAELERLLLECNSRFPGIRTAMDRRHTHVLGLASSSRQLLQNHDRHSSREPTELYADYLSRAMMGDDMVVRLGLLIPMTGASLLGSFWFAGLEFFAVV